MLVWAVVVGSIVCSLPFVYVVTTRPELRSLALRNAVSSRNQTVLVLLGVVIATAVVTSAGVVGDSLRASVRRSSVTQLGPVDEEVLTTGLVSGRSVQSAVDRSALDHEVGTLPLVTLSTTVVGRDFVARVAQAQIVEVDFTRAERFGGDAAATGISGRTPSGDRAVIGADLAAALSIAPGHRVSVDAYGTLHTFVIDRILARRGLAGLAPVTETTGSLSLNLFVPPGTIASMVREGRNVTGQGQPVSVLAVSNGNRPYDPHESELVSARLRAATAGLDSQVQPVKQLLLVDADARSSRFTRLFSAFGLFSVVGGILLLVLTFLMLARDRARSMGLLRANGLRRSRHIAALALEGWIYAVVGAALGGLVGLGIAELVVLLARGVFASQTAGQVELVFAARSSSVALGCAIGFVVSLGVVVSAAVVASRRNIVRMIKGRPDPSPELVLTARRLLGTGFGAVGLVTLGAGLSASNGVASVVGPAIAAIGAVLVVAAPERARLATSVASVVVFIWSALAVTVLREAFTGLGVAVLAAEGAVMSACAVALVSVNHAAFTRRWSEARGRRGLSLGLGLAYSRTAPKRTVLIVGMYAVAIFTLTLLVTVGQLYSHSVDAVAGRLGGAAALEVTSDATRPVLAHDVAELPGVTRVSAASAIGAQLQDGTSSAPVAVTVVGFDASFVEHGSPPVVGPGGDSVFRSVLGVVGHDADMVIVGADLHADLQSGLPGASVRVGDTLQLRDPFTGTLRAVTVAGLVDQARWAGADHVFTSRVVVNELSRGTAPANLLYVETAAGTNNDVVAAIIDGTHLPNGAYARSFRMLARDTLSAQRQFLDIGAGFATVGLLADLAAIGVLMADRIRERRRQIAMLRALGVAGGTLRRAFRVEAAIIASEGIVVGMVTGLVLAWRLGSSGGLGRHLTFSLPLGALVAIGAAVVVASLAATSLPARRAGRLRPAAALRGEE